MKCGARARDARALPQGAEGLRPGGGAPGNRTASFLERSCGAGPEFSGRKSRRSSETRAPRPSRRESGRRSRAWWRPRKPVDVPGKRVGSYELVRELGRGGMGTVYLARRADEEFRKEVALKLVRAGLDAEYFLQRFRDERQILASLTHPNIAALLDGGTTADGLPYFVMEYVEGRPINVYWCRGEPRSTGKPGSLSGRLFCRRARAPQPDRSPRPEAFEHPRHERRRPEAPGLRACPLPRPRSGSRTDRHRVPRADTRVREPRADPGTGGHRVVGRVLLGVVLYLLITKGRRPYRPPTQEHEAFLTAVVSEDPIRPAVAAPEARIPRDLEAIVLKAMRKEPQERYGSAGALAEDVGRLLEGLPVRARPDTVRYRARKFARRHRAILVAACVASLSLGVAVWLALSVANAPTRGGPRRPGRAPPSRRLSPSCRSGRSSPPRKTRSSSSAWPTRSSRSSAAYRASP